MRSVWDSGAMNVGTEMIWGALDWLRRLAQGDPPAKGEGRDDLQVKTRTQLLALAKESGIQGRYRMNKHQLVESILSAERDDTLAENAPVGSMEAPVEVRTARAEPWIPRPRRRSSERPPGEPRFGTSANERQLAVDDRQAVEESEPSLKELTELPTSYRSPRLTLLEVEPCRVYAYWDVTRQDWDAAVDRLGSRDAAPAWVVRLYDVTYIDFDGTNAHSFFDVSIETGAPGWYVDLWSGEKSYCAEIGARSPDGRFAPVCRSNFVDLPRAEPAADYGPEWLNVEGVFDRIERVSEPAPEDGSAEAAATFLLGANDDTVEHGHVLSPGALSAEKSIETIGDGGVSAESREVKSSKAATGVWAGDGLGHPHSAEPPGEIPISAGEWTDQGAGSGAAGSAWSRGAAPISEVTAQAHGYADHAWAGPRDATWTSEATGGLRGAGDQVSVGLGGATSMGVPHPVAQGQAEGSGAQVPAGGATLPHGPATQPASGELSEVTRTEMSRRYQDLLAGAPWAASAAEALARDILGTSLGAASLKIRVEGGGQRSPSSDGVSSFGSGGSWDVSSSKSAAAIDLRLNAEVVISGRAQPGQTVQVNGRWLTVSADGTFSIRLALPVAKE